ncbi:DUF7573 domain-containing protein [Natronorubrum sp. DTA28]|uniref:DUF7573 domain-containing protein n=1 Tax=Natronorubrum sp. DTA28 TaxID=3447019 RepID=UPI003F82C899
MTDDATLSDFDSGETTDDDPDGPDGPDDPDEQRSNSNSNPTTEIETGERAPDDGNDDGEPVDGETTDDDVRETPNADADRETARSTYAWGTYTCSRCETETERVWRDEGDFVCPACKPW